MARRSSARGRRRWRRASASRDEGEIVTAIRELASCGVGNKTIAREFASPVRRVRRYLRQSLAVGMQRRPAAHRLTDAARASARQPTQVSRRGMRSSSADGWPSRSRFGSACSLPGVLIPRGLCGKPTQANAIKSPLRELKTWSVVQKNSRVQQKKIVATSNDRIARREMWIASRKTFAVMSEKHGRVGDRHRRACF